ncbi:MAG: hypothetical protein IJS28_02000 [Synergistaceae bacterium]|nr:hypothetical protein [Synergistaceae bacterium]
MRKLMSIWLLVMVMCAAVCLSGGCGGSADSSDTSGDTSIPNDEPDTYNTQNVLNGTWVVIDQEEISITVDYGENTLDMLLVTASMTFSNTNIEGSSGVGFITSHETWHAFLNSGTRSYLGIKTLNIDDQVMSMKQSGADQWRCELYDQYRTVMYITVLSQNIIQVSEHRIADIDDNAGIDYEVTFTMKKQN